ncbi:hypothetical protein EON64_17220 [archaeon]|nr:MAG: hypothetical protein EON64_17220 [archaeon]
MKSDKRASETRDLLGLNLAVMLYRVIRRVQRRVARAGGLECEAQDGNAAWGRAAPATKATQPQARALPRQSTKRQSESSPH